MQQFPKHGFASVEPVSLNSVKSDFALLIFFLFLFKHPSFKHATFFCVKRHKLGLVNKEIEGQLKLYSFFSPLISIYMHLASSRTERHRGSHSVVKSPSHVINIHITYGHHSSTSLKVAQVSIICFPSMWSMCSLTSCHYSWRSLKSCIHTMQQHSS